MWDMLDVIIAVASFGLVVFLERKNIIIEYRQIREEMRVKAAYKQKAALESHASKPVIVPNVEQYRAASKTFLSVALEILKTFVAVIGAPFFFIFVLIMVSVIFDWSTDGNFYSLMYWCSLLAGLIYGAGVLRKKTWRSIFKFFGGIVLGSLIVVIIYISTL